MAPPTAVDECEQAQLPLIDLAPLWSEGVVGEEWKRCASEIAYAASTWGFFQVTNHGISKELLAEMAAEQRRLFRLPFEKKSKRSDEVLSHGSYRWGSPSATCLHQFSWSEAFHVPLSVFSGANSLGADVMERFSRAMSELAFALAGVLARELLDDGENGRGTGGGFLKEICRKETCFLRLNRYPACPYSPEIFRLTPHTDSDFLTVLWQDQVGGLQLRKNSRWIAVRPNPEALIVNIGDLFQAWSNDRYRSVEHKVMSNCKSERYSTAFFLCPDHESAIESCREPSIYKKFTFGEYRRQVEEDVKQVGSKVGLSRFLL